MSTTKVLAAAFVLSGAALLGQEPSPKAAPLEDDLLGVHFPQTAEDHLAVADEYVKLAAGHRKEADLHRRMLAAYERLARDLTTQPAPPRKRGIMFPPDKRAKPSKDPLSEYRIHCETYIRAVEIMAAEADGLAEFHRARARELRETKDP